MIVYAMTHMIDQTKLPRKKFLMRVTLILGICFVVLGAISYASREKLINQAAPSLSKTMTKAYIATHDLEKAKKINVDKIALMPPDRYARKVARAYEDLVNLGGKDFAETHNIREIMPKDEVIARIHNLTKDKLYAAIDDFPDAVIANLIRRDQKTPNSSSSLKRLLNTVQKKIDHELQSTAP